MTEAKKQESKKQKGLLANFFGIMFSGAAKGAKKYFSDEANATDLYSAMTDELKIQAEQEASDTVRNGMSGIVKTIKEDLNKPLNAMAESLNPDNQSLWLSIRNKVVGKSQGLTRILMFGVAGFVYVASKVGSLIGAELVANIATEPEKFDRNSGRLAITNFIAGVFSRGTDPEGNTHTVNTDAMTTFASTVIPGFNDQTASVQA